MASHLHITLRFFSARYHGEEWPPSPARLFQALVAGAATGMPKEDWRHECRASLHWLESLDPPEILARRHILGKSYTSYVPNNSLKEAASTKTSKQVKPKLLTSHEPGNPDVVYHWSVPDADAAAQHLPALDRAASKLRALGWGIDFAAASASLDDAGITNKEFSLFTPDTRTGAVHKVPVVGLLDHLEECHSAFRSRISTQGVDPATRPTKFGISRYRNASELRGRRYLRFELLKENGNRFAARWEEAQTVAAWMRHAIGDALLQEDVDEDWVNSYVKGHTSKENLGRRLSFLPLPSVTHSFSDGAIRRALLVEAPDATEAEAEILDLLSIKLPGLALHAEREAEPRAFLAPVIDDQFVFPAYAGSGFNWTTVTPLVLHGHNTSRREISVVKTERLLLQAFDAAGFPERIIGQLFFQTAPYWAGTGAAAAIRVPAHLKEWPRLHVGVVFKECVKGPVLAGLGRHYGLGVFATRG
jgi:CRISPR-associated protein Csb2